MPSLIVRGGIPPAQVEQELEELIRYAGWAGLGLPDLRAHYGERVSGEDIHDALERLVTARQIYRFMRPAVLGADSGKLAIYYSYWPPRRAFACANE
ncbi:MAG TPA: hypothetical protein VGU20_32235 [Stellaceae bacterium]|nr:hypothetical protein [Stellaceae bacterium]